MTASELEAIDVLTESGARAFNESIRRILADANTRIPDDADFAHSVDDVFAVFGERSVNFWTTPIQSKVTVYEFEYPHSSWQRTRASAFVIACLRANGLVTG